MDRRTTAYHEAGHAVVAHQLNFRVESVDIVQDEENAGSTNVGWPDGFHQYVDNADEVFENRMAVLVAGVVAIATKNGRSIDFNDVNTDPSLWGADWEHFSELVLRVAGEDEREQLAVQERAMDRAESILRQNWADVERLANALLEHETLGAEQVARLLARPRE